MSQKRPYRSTFTKSERLTDKRAFEELVNNGHTIKAFPVKLLYRIVDNPEHNLKVGFSVPKRLFKKVVVRNKLKRRMRESFRLNKYQLYDALESKSIGIELLFIFTGKEIDNYSKINEQIFGAIGRLKQEL